MANSAFIKEEISFLKRYPAKGEKSEVMEIIYIDMDYPAETATKTPLPVPEQLRPAAKRRPRTLLSNEKVLAYFGLTEANLRPERLPTRAPYPVVEFDTSLHTEIGRYSSDNGCSWSKLLYKKRETSSE